MPDDKKKTFAGSFAQSFARKISESNFFGIKEAYNGVKDGATEAVAETAATYAIGETQKIVDQIKEDTAPIIEETARKLNPEQKDTWELIRNNIVPQGGFFRTIFARLLWIGAKASSFVGALVVDRWTGRDEKGQNMTNIEYILAWLLGKTVGNNQTGQSSNKPRSLGVPKDWVTNTKSA